MFRQNDALCCTCRRGYFPLASRLFVLLNVIIHCMRRKHLPHATQLFALCDASIRPIQRNYSLHAMRLFVSCYATIRLMRSDYFFHPMINFFLLRRACSGCVHSLIDTVSGVIIADIQSVRWSFAMILTH